MSGRGFANAGAEAGIGPAGGGALARLLGVDLNVAGYTAFDILLPFKVIANPRILVTNASASLAQSGIAGSIRVVAADVSQAYVDPIDLSALTGPDALSTQAIAMTGRVTAEGAVLCLTAPAGFGVTADFYLFGDVLQ